MDSHANHLDDDEFDGTHQNKTSKKSSKIEKKQKNKKWLRSYELDDEDDDELPVDEEE